MMSYSFPRAILLVCGILIATTFLWVAYYHGILTSQTSRFNGKTAVLVTKYMRAPMSVRFINQFVVVNRNLP